MINKEQLLLLFKTNNIVYNEIHGYIVIEKKMLSIYIHYNNSYTKILSELKKYCLFRKNCWINNTGIFYSPHRHIYFHEDYIHYILRQKTINKILND